MERLDKLLASTGRWSRREAKALIQAGRVLVDGMPARRGEDKADPSVSRILVDGAVLDWQAHTYIMLSKPAGLLTATEDARQKTVLDLLPDGLRRKGLFPVGRLDKDTEGLLLLTNDGPLAHRLLAPRSHVDKVYYVETDGELDEGDAWAVRAGITLADGYVCLPGELELLSGNCAQITLREGKYHQVKRMLAARGKSVVYLKRVRFGPLVLDEKLPKGGWRALTEGERQALFRQ